MKIDVVTIFPDYLTPLRLSLVGKAVASGRVELGVHDLRTWTTDRHRTVDDTPYGGGAGMVMLPEPWGQVLDTVVPPDADRPPARLVVLTPAGRPFTQAVARELAAEDHLLFACGRYEGIDARVAEEAATRMRVDELSIGDYVLNGGEAAVLVIVEAVVRLMPGVVGNPASLTEESHAPEHDGLLEGPVYTKPTRWRGYAVPPVLLSGDHGRIAAWRREQAVARTRVRRPDLLPPDPDALVIEPVRPADVGPLWSLQRAAYVQEGHVTGSLQIPPLAESYAEFRAGLADAVVLVGRIDGRLIASARGRAEGDVFWVERLMVVPDRQGEGLGGRLLAAIEAEAPAGTRSFQLLTGAVSRGNISFYKRRGYRVTGTRPMPGADVVVMERLLTRSAGTAGQAG